MTERLYAYLDESGQETEGRIFICTRTHILLRSMCAGDAKR
jgi:hypothetical protein